MTSDKPPSAAMKTRGAASLRHRDFLIFILSNQFVFLAHHMLMVAIAYHIYDVTGDALSVAYIHLAILGPLFVFAILTGYVSDRFDRRMVLMFSAATMVAGTASILALSANGLVITGWIYVPLILLGTARAFHNPATHAFVPNLVPIEIFANAVAWNNATIKSGQIIGPALGGFIYLLGPEAVYATATVCFALGAAGTSLIRRREAGAKGRKTTISELLAGAVYVWRKRIVLGAILVDLSVTLTASVIGVLPIIAKDILVVGAAGAGMLRSAMAIGALTAALGLTRASITAHAGKIMMVGSMMLAVLAIGVGLSTFFPLSICFMALMGAFEMVSINLRHTMVQIATPDDMRGRVSAVSTVTASSANELGGFRAASIAGLIGAVPSIVGGGLVGVALIGLIWKAFPELSAIQRVDREF